MLFFCDKTKWSSCLHLVVLLPFLFFVVLFWILSFFCCFHSSQKRTPQKTGHSKNPKKQKCRKTRQIKKSVSAVVFTDSVLKFFGVGLKIEFLAENTIKIVVSASFQTGKNTQKLAKMLSQNLVQGWVKTWSKYVAQQNWTKFWLKKWCFFCLCFARFSLKSHSPCRKKKIFEKQKKTKKRKLGPSFDSKKGYFWTKLWLYSIYIYMPTYIYIYRPAWCLHFSQNFNFPQFTVKITPKMCTMFVHFVCFGSL